MTQERQEKPTQEKSQIPVMFVGDSPTIPTGLGRILRDIATLTQRHVPEVRVAQLGLKYSGARCNWHVYPIKDEESWGQGDIADAWEDWAFGDVHQGVVFSVWDPGRCPALVWGLGEAMKDPERNWLGLGRQLPQLWGYFAVDAENAHGGLGALPAEILGRGYQRVLAYCQYGSEVIERTIGRKVPWLPHGIDLDTFKPRPGELPETIQEEWVESGWPIVGVVATNTPRKNWGAVFAALEGVDCHLWILTDQLVTEAWSLPGLAQEYGRDNPMGCHVITKPIGDEEVSRWYGVCDATIAPGSGEGFGYPIVESLACGTPVVHVNYAGGREFVPRADWRFEVAAERVEGAYALVRPVVRPRDVLEAVRAAVKAKRENPELTRAYCRASVAHLDWRELWPHWEAWFRAGLEGML